MAYHRGDLDPETADRLLSGWLSPDDAPPGYREVAQLLQDTHMEDGPGEVRDDAVIVAMVDAIVTSGPARPKGKHVLTRIVTAKAAAVAAIVTLAATGAAAATGSLPDAAQDGIAEAVSHLGIDLPDSAEPQPQKLKVDQDAPSDDVDNNPAAPVGTEDDDDTDGPATSSGDGTDVPATGAENQGEVVSDAAHNADPEGGKGDEVSPIARDNHGQEVSSGNPPDDPGNGNGNPPDAPGNGNGNPPDDPGNGAGNPPDDPGNGNGNGQP
jgi:hypothetical protein